MNKKRVVALVLAGIMIFSVIAGLLVGGGKDSDTYDYSEGLDSNGFFKKVKALDYVQLPEYENYEIPFAVANIDDSALQEQIDYVMLQYAYDEPDYDAERTIQTGDTVNIDYVGTIDGVEFSGGNTNGVGTDVTIGVTNYIDGFLDQLIGHKVGENFDINVTFPEGYGVEELNGKRAVFNVTINCFYKEIQPEFTDEFVAENFSDVAQTTEEYREYLRERMADYSIKSWLAEKISAETVVLDYPQQAIDYENKYIEYNLTETARSYGMDLATLLSYYGIGSIEEYCEQALPNTQATVAAYMISQGICEKENIKVSDKDVEAYFAENMGEGAYEVYREYYGDAYLKMAIMNEFVLEHIIEKLPVETEPVVYPAEIPEEATATE